MKIQPLRDQLIGQRFWFNDILHTVAYKEDDTEQYIITYYRYEWIHRKYQRGAKYEKVFHKVIYNAEEINLLFKSGHWVKYENKTTTNFT